MHRIDTATAEADKFGTGKDGFTEGNPAAGVAATATTDDWFDAVQEEIAAPIELYGGSLLKADHHQLMRTMRMTIARLAIGGMQKVADGAVGDSFNSVAMHTNGITAGEEYAVACGNNDGLASSPDGYSWTAQSAAASGSTMTFYDVAHRPSGTVRWVAVGGSSAGVPIIETSDAGAATWTIQSHAATGALFFLRVKWIDALSLFVAVGIDGEIQTSPDGTVWTKRTPAASYAGIFNGITYGNGLVVIVGQSGAALQTSPDGITWTNRTPGGASDFTDITYGDGIFLAITAAGKAYTSTDGITWSLKTITTLGLGRVGFSDTFGWVFGVGGEGPAVTLDPVNQSSIVVNRVGLARSDDVSAGKIAVDNRMILAVDAVANGTVYRSITM